MIPAQESMSLASPIKNSDRVTILKDRAQGFSAIREFFALRAVTEVDCPLLSANASVDAHIDLIEAIYNGCGKRYLHSSPEYGMKRLLAEGIGDIYQLSHVFRDGEEGSLHSPEFMMCEWYRLGFSFEEMIQETCKFCEIFLGEQKPTYLSYRDAFLLHADIDPFTASDLKLKNCLKEEAPFQSRDDLLNLIIGCIIQPKLKGLVSISHYPASQAALAQTTQIDGFEVAKRFELFFNGVELANGYKELASSKLQRPRFEQANELRIELGKKPLPIDENFLQALDQLPACCGVAVGIDRLFMLRHNKTSLKEILPFHWPIS